jgi:predicted secreted protein
LKHSTVDREVELDTSAGEAVLSLAESPSTGYRWRLADVPPEVEVVSSTFNPPDPGRPGQGGSRQFTLRVRSAGEYVLTAESARGDGPAAARVHVTLRSDIAW